MYPEIIGIDCDEVLSETMNQLLKHPECTQKDLTRNDITSYDLREVEKLNISIEKAYEIFFGLFASPELFEIQPVLGAKKRLQARKQEGKKLIMVTGRPTQYQERTQQWIDQHFPALFDDFLFANVGTESETTKSELCKQAGIEVVIEDNLGFVAELSQAGIPCFLLDKPRNQDYTPERYPNVIKVHSRAEIDLSVLDHIHG